MHAQSAKKFALRQAPKYMQIEYEKEVTKNKKRTKCEKTINASRTRATTTVEGLGAIGEFGCLWWDHKKRANPTNTQKPNGCRLLPNPPFMLKSNNNKNQTSKK